MITVAVIQFHFMEAHKQKSQMKEVTTTKTCSNCELTNSTYRTGYLLLLCILGFHGSVLTELNP